MPAHRPQLGTVSRRSQLPHLIEEAGVEELSRTLVDPAVEDRSRPVEADERDLPGVGAGSRGSAAFAEPPCHQMPGPNGKQYRQQCVGGRMPWFRG